MFSQVSVILLGVGVCEYISSDDHQVSLAGRLVCPGGGYVQGVSMSRGLGWVCQGDIQGFMVYPTPGHGTWDTSHLVLTPSGDPQNTYDW